MPDQAPNIDPNIGPGKLVYDKERRTIMSVPRPAASEQARTFELCDNVVRRLREIADIDGPPVLVRGEADLLEKLLGDLKRAADITSEKVP